MSEPICKLIDEEASTIRDIYEKKLALENLAKIISPSENNEMYERLISDYGTTMREFNDWWSSIIASHHLPPDNYAVDFVEKQLIRQAAN